MVTVTLPLTKYDRQYIEKSPYCLHIPVINPDRFYNDIGNYAYYKWLQLKKKFKK